jgi:hypothetical protein
MRSKEMSDKYDAWKKENPDGYPFKDNTVVDILNGAIIYENMFPYSTFHGKEVVLHQVIVSKTVEGLTEALTGFMEDNSYYDFIQINGKNIQSQPQYPHAHVIKVKTP